MAEPIIFNVIQAAFTLIFTVDLLFRISADRAFFCHYKNKEFMWNVSLGLSLRISVDQMKRMTDASERQASSTQVHQSTPQEFT